MNLEDIIYLLLLCFSMFFGVFYRKIGDIETKKVVGSFIGLCIVIIVSGYHAIHLMITVLINAGFILYGDKRWGKLESVLPTCIDIHQYMTSYLLVLIIFIWLIFGIFLKFLPSLSNCTNKKLTWPD